MASFYSRLAVLVAITGSMIATPVSAETANFATIQISPSFDPVKGEVSGYTGGSYSLSAISKRDRDRHICTGFADTKPDHILILEKDFDRLKILVNTGGYDSTLLIKGPDDETIRCSEGTDRNRDAILSDRHWQRGTYLIWVGIFNIDIKHNYKLTVEEQ
jgi:hypothetical protein